MSNKIAGFCPRGSTLIPGETLSLCSTCVFPYFHLTYDWRSRFIHVTMNLDLQSYVRWKNWWKHGSTCLQAKHISVPGIIQFNPRTRHAWWTCYGVEVFFQVVNECGTQVNSNYKNLVLKMDETHAHLDIRLKWHPTFIYNCHFFGRLYKLVLGHLNN